MTRMVLCFGLLILACFAFVQVGAQEEKPFSWFDDTPVPVGRVGGAGENLKVLPYDDQYDLLAYMQGIMRTLGVSCVYCHNLDDFAVDDPRLNRAEHKNATRKMIRMVYGVNEYFEKDDYLSGLIGYSLFEMGDLRDAAGLAVELREADENDPLSKYIYEQLYEDTQELLNEFDETAPASKLMREALILELNRILRGPSLYSDRRFTGIELSDDIQALIASQPRGVQLIRLNRLLMEAAYPKKIVQANAISCSMCHRGSPHPTRESLSKDLANE